VTATSANKAHLIDEFPLAYGDLSIKSCCPGTRKEEKLVALTTSLAYFNYGKLKTVWKLVLALL
jgi:hypothetical protein